VKYGVDVKAIGQFSKTTLYYAALGKDVEIAKVLLKCGVDRHAKDRDGEKAIDKA